MQIRTEAQREQARINGRKSRGPITPEGKEASSRNAVKHGMRSSKLLPEEEQPTYEARRDAYVAAEKEPPGPRRLNLLESMAMASVQVEIACSSRNAASEQKIKDLDRAERTALTQLFESAVAQYRTAPTIEAFEELSRTADGCEFVGCEWGLAGRAAHAAPKDQPLPAAIHDRLIALIPSIPNLLTQERLRADLESWSELPRIPTRSILLICQEMMLHWNKLTEESRRDFEHDQQLRRSIAKIDTSREGALAHRYMQSSLNTMIQINKQLDAEYDREWKRRWKEEKDGIVPFPIVEEAPLPNEPGASQAIEAASVEDVPAVASGGAGGLSADAGPDAGIRAKGPTPRPPVNEPAIGRSGSTASLPNEPGASQRTTAPRVANSPREYRPEPRPARNPLPNEPDAPRELVPVAAGFGLPTF